MAGDAAICLRNANLLEEQVRESKKAAMMTKLLTVFTEELDVKKAVQNIVSCAEDILDADRVSLFLVDNEDLVCDFSKDVKGFRFDKTKGVAGQVITTGKVLNVVDAYDFAHFNPDVDKKSGYLTKSILCGPVVNAKGETIAVIQAVNKRSGDQVRQAQFHERLRASQRSRKMTFLTCSRVAGSTGSDSCAYYYVVHNTMFIRALSNPPQIFTAEDEALLVGLTGQAGIGLQNAQLYDRERYQRALNATLLNVATAVSSELDSHAMFQTIMDSARELMHCDRCSLFLVDHDTQEFWSFVTESSGVEFRFPLTKGVIGESFASSSPLNIPDVYKHPTFNAEIDAQSGYRTQSVLCVPIKTRDGFVVGVIEMINKLDTLADRSKYTKFTEQDQVRAIALRRCAMRLCTIRVAPHAPLFTPPPLLFTHVYAPQVVLSSFTNVIAGALTNSLIFNELETHTSIVESTLQGITSYIITLDNLGRLKTSNHDLQELFGATDNDMRAKPYSEWLGQEGNEQFRRNIESVYDTKSQITVKNEVLSVQAKAGSSLTVNYNIVPLKIEPKRRRFSRRGSELMRRGSLMVSDSGSAPGSPLAQRSSLTAQIEGLDQLQKLDDAGSSSGRARLDSVDSVGALPEPNSPSLELEMQGVVIVLENITEGRIRMSAIQRYQRRLNEMENQVRDFSDLKSKLQSLDINDFSDLQQIKPETTKQLAKLALCLNEPEGETIETPIYNAYEPCTNPHTLDAVSTNSGYRSIRATMMQSADMAGSPPIAMYGSGSPHTKSFMTEYRSVLSPKALKSWDWSVLEVNDTGVLVKAVSVMFEELQVSLPNALDKARR